MREHPAAQQNRTLVGVTFIVLGFAARERLPRERMPSDKGNPFLRTQGRQPIPGEQTLARPHDLLARRSNDASERFGRGGQILMDEFRTAWIEDTDVQRLGR